MKKPIRMLVLSGALAVVVGVGLLSTDRAWAQNAQWNALFDRIIRLEANVKNMARSGAGNGGGAGYQQTQSNAQMRQLLSEIRQMRQQLLTMDARLRRLEKLNGRSGKLAPRQPAYRPPANQQPAYPKQAPFATSDQGSFAQTDLEQYSINRQPQIFVEIEDGKNRASGSQGFQPAPAVPAARPANNWQSAAPAVRPVAPQPIPQTSGKYASLTPQAGTTPLQDGVVRQSLDGAQVTENSIAKKLYDRSSAALRARRYGAAESGFKSFLRKHEKHNLASGAQFMLGETYYVQRNWRLAAQSYLKGYRKYPNGRRAGDTLLKLGMSLGKLGQKSQSCGAFEAVVSKYKTSGAMAQAKKEMKRAGC